MDQTLLENTLSGASRTAYINTPKPIIYLNTYNMLLSLIIIIIEILVYYSIIDVNYQLPKKIINLNNYAVIKNL